jgi:hypothetical protein
MLLQRISCCQLVLPIESLVDRSYRWDLAHPVLLALPTSLAVRFSKKAPTFCSLLRRVLA